MYIAFENDPNKNNRFKGTMFLICIAIFLIMCAATCEGQVYKAVDIPMILNRTDSVSRLELLTAKKFHKKINEYRKLKGVCQLRWSDTLYISTMNHNMWMSYNKTPLLHGEIRNTAHFTGEEPQTRLDYVLGVRTLGASENCAWFSVFGNTIDEIAETAALTAFTSLKDDKPHSDNMLRYNDKTHAAHFSYKGGYCTSEFYGTRLLKN